MNIEVPEVDFGSLEGPARVEYAKRWACEQAIVLMRRIWQDFPAPNEREVSRVIDAAYREALCSAMLIEAWMRYDDSVAHHERQTVAAAMMLGCSTAVKVAVALLADWPPPERRASVLSELLDLVAGEMLDESAAAMLLDREPF